MSNVRRPEPDEVEHLLRNAQLRDELEPFLDEAVECVNVLHVPTPVENEYLASMLAWERAPVLPIARWFEPEMKLAPPDTLDEMELHLALWDAIERLYSQRIVLEFTDHLSDRALYRLIFRDILPSPEKKIDSPHNYLHWDCCDASNDPELWLRYYASEEERCEWLSADLSQVLPPREAAPFPRELPRRPM
jgi:hypothetical protein